MKVAGPIGPRYGSRMDERQIRWRRHEDAANRWAVAEAAAAPGLAHAIRGFSHYEEHVSSFTTRRELPGTQGVLIINFGDTIYLTGGDGDTIRLGAGEGFVAGVHTQSALSRTERGRQRGVHVFLPLASLRRLFAPDMRHIADRAVPLEAILGVRAAAMGATLVEKTPGACFDALEAWLARRLADAPSPDRAVNWAIARLDADPAARIDALARDIGWSRKHFAQRFRAAAGVTPRAYARLRRFERLMHCLTCGTRPHWADLAAAHGFADQPHMAREVRDISGLTPTVLLQRLLPSGGGVLEA